MSSMGFTQSDLDNLKAALVSGALRVQLGDRMVIYRSQADLIAAIRMVQAELNSNSVQASAATVQATFSKGTK